MTRTYQFTLAEMENPLYTKAFEFGYEQGYDDGRESIVIEQKVALKPDPDTGLMKCGCGGKAKVWLSDFTRFTYLITDYEVGCTECAMTTGWVRGKQENAMKVWNTAMGWKGGSK